MMEIFPVSKLIPLLIISATIFQHPNKCNAKTGTDGCILVFGGSSTSYDVEDAKYVNASSPLNIDWLYPTDDQTECDKDEIKLPTMTTGATIDVSGCYLADTQQLVTRELLHWRHDYNRSSVVYSFVDGSMRRLSLPHNGSYITLSASAAVGDSKCISCGGHIGRRKAENSSTVNKCYQYTAGGSEWTPITPLPVHRDLAAAVSLGTHSYYVFGGTSTLRKESCSNKVVNVHVKGPNVKGKSKFQTFRYDVDRGKWDEETPMRRRRYLHAAARLSSTKFIVCGGMPCERDSTPAKCEIYDHETKLWQPAADMTENRFWFAMANFNGDIYAIGGKAEDYGKNHDTVEVYDAAKDQWTKTKMRLKHAKFGFVVIVIPKVNRGSQRPTGSSSLNRGSLIWIVGLAILLLTAVAVVIGFRYFHAKHRSPAPVHDNYAMMYQRDDSVDGGTVTSETE